MKIFIGQYWVPFPQSEYGGNWTVIAKDKEECIELLKQSDPYNKGYWHKIDLAVIDAYCFELQNETVSRVVTKFYT